MFAHRGRDQPTCDELMTQDYRALCAELSEALCGYTLSPDDCLLVNQARVALAEQPVRPTVMEIIELANEIEAAELGQVDLVRAALARWGTSNLAQVRSSLEDHQPLGEDDVDLYLEQ